MYVYLYFFFNIKILNILAFKKKGETRLENNLIFFHYLSFDYYFGDLYFNSK